MIATSVELFLAQVCLKISEAQAVVAQRQPSHSLHHVSRLRNQSNLERVKVLLARPLLKWPLDLKEGKSCVVCFSVLRLLWA